MKFPICPQWQFSQQAHTVVGGLYYAFVIAVMQPSTGIKKHGNITEQ